MTSGLIPRCAVGCFVFRQDGKFISGMRKGSLGAGTYALAGGHLEFGETFEDCARREIKEECDIDLGSVTFLTAVNTVYPEERTHFVSIITGAFVGEGVEPKLVEPDKCEGWKWTTWDEFVAWNREGKLFGPLCNLMIQHPQFDPLKEMQRVAG